MAQYVATEFSSEMTGGTLADVVCDNCGCAYHYELSRTGYGSAKAHYNLGRKSAQARAEQQSTKDLLERLSKEAELVPCPTCCWINEDLILGYRRSRYRWINVAAPSVGFFGSVIFLFVAYFLWIGDQADRPYAIYALIGGPILCIGAALGLLWLQKMLRARIQPNRNFPDLPTVPPGTPRPICIDQDGNQTVFDNDLIYPNDYERGVLFANGEIAFPRICCFCAARADDQFEQSYSPESKIDVPICSDCHKSREGVLMRITWIAYAVVFAIGIALSWTAPDRFGFIFGLVLTAIFGLIPAAFVGVLFDPLAIKIKTVDRSRGIYRAIFSSQKFEVLVKQVNPKL